MDDVASVFASKEAGVAPAVVVAVHALRSGRLLLQDAVVPPTLPAILLLSGTDVSQTMAPFLSSLATAHRAWDAAVATRARSLELDDSVATVTRVLQRVQAVVAFSPEMLHTVVAFCAAVCIAAPAVQRVLPQAIDVRCAALDRGHVAGSGIVSLTAAVGAPADAQVFLLPCGLRAVKAPGFVVQVHCRRLIPF